MIIVLNLQLDDVTGADFEILLYASCMLSVNQRRDGVFNT